MVEPNSASKLLRARYAGRCAVCGAAVPVGAEAHYDSGTKTITCVSCHGIPEDPADVAPPEIFAGVAGASARREHDRRSTARENRIRKDHPRIGRVYLALSDDPQSTKAWATGAVGEERLGRQLDKVVGPSIRVLHDRRIPGTKANIDHIVVSASGVFVIDAKRYTGAPRKIVEGGLFGPRVSKLKIGSRDQTKLVAGVQRQAELVRNVLAAGGWQQTQVRAMLCFIDADWPILGGDFSIDGVSVLSPKRALDHIRKVGDMDEATVDRMFGVLAGHFPVA